MKSSYFSPLLLVALAANASAAIYVSDFNNLTYVPSQQIGGQDGWSINNPSVPFLSYTVGWDNGTGAGVTTAAALGGRFAIPTENTIGLNHGYGEELGRTTAIFDFAFVDSNAGTGSLRDAFSFSAYNGATNIFSVVFTPAQVNPTVTPLGVWNLSYNVNGVPAGDLFLSVEELATYQFYLDFKKHGLQTNVVVGLGNPGGALLERFRTVDLDSSQTITSFGFNWITGVPGGGDNYLIFDNLSVVPEPSSALLVGLAGLAFVTGRRRLA